MGFGLNISKGLVTAATKLLADDHAARQIYCICKAAEFANYDEQKAFASHAAEALVNLRGTVATGIVKTLAANDITFANATLKAIDTCKRTDCAEILVGIGVEYSSLRDKAWELMAVSRWPEIKNVSERLANRNENYHNQILRKLLSSGSFSAIEAATNVFYLKPDSTIPFIQAILDDNQDRADVSPNTFHAFFSAISNPANLRPFVHKTYKDAYGIEPVDRFNDRKERVAFIDPHALQTLAKLKELFKTADDRGILPEGVKNTDVLRIITNQAESQYAAEILHDAMYNPKP